MKTGTFLVVAADEETATLRDVEDGQIVTLAENPDLEDGTVLEGTVEPEPPLEVAYRVAEVEARRTIPVERSDLEPTAQARDIAAEQGVGEVTRRERAGEGELHVLTVEAGRTDSAVADVIEDEETVARAARLGVDRVEVRADDGVVSVRYLPD